MTGLSKWTNHNPQFVPTGKRGVPLLDDRILNGSSPKVPGLCGLEAYGQKAIAMRFLLPVGKDTYLIGQYYEVSL